MFVQAQRMLQQYEGSKNINFQPSLEDIKSKSDFFYMMLLFNLHIFWSFQKAENNLRKSFLWGKALITRSLSEAFFLTQLLLKINLKFRENIWKIDKHTCHAIMYLSKFFHVLIISCCLFLLLGHFWNKPHDSFSTSFGLHLMDIDSFLKSSNLVFKCQIFFTYFRHLEK